MYTRQNVPDRSPRPRPSSPSLRRTFCRRPLLSAFLANPRKRQRETETERKGFVVTKLELNAFPKRKGSRKKRLKFSKLLFLQTVLLQNFNSFSLFSSILSLRRATSSLNFLIDGIISRAVFDGFQVPAQKKLRARGKRVCILRPRHAGLDDGFEEVVHA